MIPRYSLPEIADLFTDEARFRAWLEVEVLAVEGGDTTTLSETLTAPVAAAVAPAASAVVRIVRGWVRAGRAADAEAGGPTYRSGVKTTRRPSTRHSRVRRSRSAVA